MSQLLSSRCRGGAGVAAVLVRRVVDHAVLPSTSPSFRRRIRSCHDSHMMLSTTTINASAGSEGTTGSLTTRSKLPRTAAGRQERYGCYRSFHSSASLGSRGEYYKLRHHKKATQACPFEVLGLPRDGKRKTKAEAPKIGTAAADEAINDTTTPDSTSTIHDHDYDENGMVKFRAVKTAFLKIAMAHHPDTTDAETPEELDAHRDVFIKAREAFEKIASGPNGIAVLRSELHGSDSELDDAPFDVDAWFQSETGHAMPFMDLQTMKEVAKMTETVGHGLDRDGGMWLLAEMVSDSVKKGGSGDGASLLRLEAGDSTSGSGKGSVDGILRRRRRRDR